MAKNKFCTYNNHGKKKKELLLLLLFCFVFGWELVVQRRYHDAVVSAGAAPE